MPHPVYLPPIIRVHIHSANAFKGNFLNSDSTALGAYFSLIEKFTQVCRV